MPELQYLQLQPVEPPTGDDTTVSPLDQHAQDDTIDLTQEADGASLGNSWQQILTDLEKEPDTIASK